MASELIAPPDDRYIAGYTSTGTYGGFKNLHETVNVGPRLQSLSTTWATYGVPIPITHGVRMLRGHTIWGLPLTERSTTVKSKDTYWEEVSTPAITTQPSRFRSHFMHFPATTTSVEKQTTVRTTTYEYFGSWAVSFGYAPGTASRRDITRMWADGVLIYTRRAERTEPTSTIWAIISALANTSRQNTDIDFTFYSGSEDQPVDPFIAANSPDNEASAYRGQMYAIFKDIPLEQFGNRIPNITVEIADSTEEDSIQMDMVVPSGSAAWNTTFAVDWNRNRLWAHDRNDAHSLMEFDTSNFNFLRKITASQPLDRNSLAPLPWFNMIATPREITGNYTDLILMDISSGAIITTVDLEPHLFGHVTGLVPTRVMGVQGIETYLLAVTNFNDFGVYRVLAPKEVGNATWELRRVFSKKLSSTGGARGITPGGVYDGYSELFFNIDPTIYKVTIRAGASSSDDLMVDYGVFFSDAGVTRITLIYYHGLEDVLLSYEDGYWRKRRTEDAWLEDSSVFQLAGFTSVRPNNFWMTDSRAGTIAGPVATSGEVRELNIADMSVRTYASGGVYSGSHISDSQTKSYITGTYRRVFYDAISDGRVTLASYMNVIAAYAGYAVPAEFEVDSNIDDMIDGGLILERMSFRKFLTDLSLAYRFDIIESEGKIKLVRKAVSFVDYEFEIPQVELAVISEGDEDNISFKSRREDEVSLPRRAEIHYISKDLDYQWSIQSAQRSAFPVQLTPSDEIMSVQLPVIINHAEAKTLAYKMLYAKAWASRASYAFRLSQKYQYLEPSDVGQVTAGAFTYTVSLKEIHYNADLSLSVKAQSYLSEEPIVNLAADGGSVLEQSLQGYVEPLMIPIDSKLLRPQFDATHPQGDYVTMFYLVSPLTDTTSWKGAYGEISLDGGFTFDEAASNNVIPVLGNLTTNLPSTDTPHLIQETGSFQVRILTSNTGDLASVTYEEMMNGRNHALVGTPERGWEVIQFKDVEEISTGLYKLSYLVRGRRGTDILTVADSPPGVVGSWFILLSMDWLTVSSLPMATKDTEVMYRVTSFGESVQGSFTQQFTFEAEAAKPLTPVHLEAEWSGSDIDFTFIRQTRGPFEWEDEYETLPLFEETNNFRVTLYTDLTFATASDTIDLDGDDVTSGRYHATITAAMLNTAYGTTTPDTIYVGAKQYSEYLGAYGDERTAALNTGA